MPIASYFAVTDDGGVVLDLKRDQVLKLNTTAAEIWSLLVAGMPEAQIVAKIAAKYSVEPSRVAQDLQDLVAKSAALGLCRRSVSIAPSGSTSVAPPSFPAIAEKTHESPSTIRVLRALLALALFDAILTLRNLESLCAVVESLAVRSQRRSVPQSRAVDRVSAAVEQASVWYPKKSLCLQRSAVTTCLLRQDGVPAKMAVGIRSMPFLAHAWVEIEGEVVNDASRVKAFYRSIALY